LTATEIARRSGMHKTKVSRAVAGLERRGWLARDSDAADRRVARLALTPAGRAALADLGALARAYDAELRAGCGPDGVAALDRGLAAIEAALPRALDGRPGAGLDGDADGPD
jgi:DNA-binding MarR family transcriptional regulator